MNDSAGNAETLLHAAGEAVDEGIGFGGEADLGNGVVNAGGELGGVELVATGEVVDIFPDFEIAVDGEEVREVADVLLGFGGLAGDINVVDGDGAGSGSEQSGDHFEGGGFAGTVGADEAEDFAGGDVEGEMVGGDKSGRGAGLVVLLGDRMKLDHVSPSTA